ncbi:hypothetical protein CGRA01v4_14594 [Colletotrichum graminicola]|nr:hypothetical protein CGRA01v4_14594 [Colletotrichum graminicola]
MHPCPPNPRPVFLPLSLTLSSCEGGASMGYQTIPPPSHLPIINIIINIIMGMAWGTGMTGRKSLERHNRLGRQIVQYVVPRSLPLVVSVSLRCRSCDLSGPPSEIECT